KTVKQARERIVELLRESGDLIADPKPVTHAVKFYERGDRPLEIVTTRQWYIRNGGRDVALAHTLLERGRELRWFPPYMRARCEGGSGRSTGGGPRAPRLFSGAPFPAGSPPGPDGEPDYAPPLPPAEDALPVDPSSDVPDGYTAGQRGQAGGFVADPDVMDT